MPQSYSRDGQDFTLSGLVPESHSPEQATMHVYVFGSARQLRLPCFLSNPLTGMASDPLQWAVAELAEIAVVEVP